MKDYDQVDVPRGTDPLIRYDKGREFFNYAGLWYQVGSLPDGVRMAYLAEQIRRERAEKGALPLV